jgi:hypothetical protein
VKRADRRTPEQIAIQRYTHLITLPDTDLCQTDHRTSALPEPHPPCPTVELTEHDGAVACGQPGRWGYHVPGQPARRGCDRHAAAAIRARLYLQRNQLERDIRT